MPTYRNSTNSDIVYGISRFPAQTDYEVDYYLEGSLPVGLSLISNEPVYNNIILDSSYTASAGGDVPTIVIGASGDTGLQLEFYVESGEFEIRLNGPAVGAVSMSAVNPAILLTDEQKYERRFSGRCVNEIYIHCIANGKIYVRVSKY